MTPRSSAGRRAGPGDEAGAPVLPQDPPPAVVRAVAWLLLALFAVAVGAAFLVRVPDTLELPFVLTAREPAGAEAALRGRATLSEADARRIPEGARARLVFEAFPAERYGSVSARFEPRASFSPAGDALHAFAALEESAIGVGPDRRALRPGLTGTARVVVGDRSIADRLLAPRR
jgi:hypothetical protein